MNLHIFKRQEIVFLFRGRLPVSPFSLMNLKAFILFISIVFISTGACTSEEQPDFKRPKVVVKIKKPDSVTPPPAPEDKEKSGSKPESDLAPPVDKTLKVEKQPVSPVSDEKPGQGPIEKEKDSINKGIYKVQKGDTLSIIAGRKEIYDDPEKWPSLFLLNIDRLGEMKVADHFDLKWSGIFHLGTPGLDGLKVAEDFETKELTEGLRLKFITPDQAIKNLNKLGSKPWVVNVVSSRNPKRIVPSAIALMGNGYQVYITKAVVKERQWLRLRVGFYEKRPEAIATGKKIMSILKIGAPWVVKIRQIELQEFGGYYSYFQDSEKRS